MKLCRNIIRSIVAVVTVAIVLPACTTAQLQKQYPTFSVCFHEQKAIATTGGAVLGAVFGAAVGGGGKQSLALGAAGAVVGAIIGNRVAWESCLKAFPPKSQTAIVSPRPISSPSTATPLPGAPPDAGSSLTVQSVTAQPVVFGRDLEASAQYVFVSDKSGSRDVKARVSRNLLFTAPDGSKQEIVSSSEDTIQQGIIRTTFAIPTPSLQDAPELAQTRDWAIKFVVEVDGMRQEKVVSLQVTGLQQDSEAKSSPAPQQKEVSQTKPPAAAPAAYLPQVQIAAGVSLMDAPNSNKVVYRNKQLVSARLLQQTLINGVTWLQVEVPGGARGWISGAKK
jgi:hypothetical protein